MRLIDVDALKKEWHMGNKCEECERNARDCNYYDFISRMDVCSMLDDAPTVGGWISVKDKLPEDKVIYLVYAPTYRPGSSRWQPCHDGIMFSRWNGEAWSIELPGGYSRREILVKYWMPMPELPKEEEHETTD